VSDVRNAFAVQTESVPHSNMTQNRILVVEDEPLIRMFVVDCLEDAGFKVEEAGSSSEAMSQVASETLPFAAAIVDVGLPDRPGDQLAAEIRARWPELPIIIASGHDRNELAKRFIGDGRVGVLGKPYNSSTMMDALGKLGVTAPTGRLT